VSRRLWLLLLAPPAVIAAMALPAAAQGRSACPGGLQPQGTVVAIDGEVTARGQDGGRFPVSVGTMLCPLDEITTGSRSRVEFRLAGKDTTTGTSNNAVTIIPAPDSDCVTLLGGVLALISSVEGRHCVRTPFIDAGIEGTEAVVAVDGPTGDSFVLVRVGEVGVRDRRDPGSRLLLEAGPDGRAAAFATEARRLTVATPDNVPAKFRDLLLRPEGATDWAVYYPPILLGTPVADPAVREAAALLDGGDPAAAERALAARRLDGRAEAVALSLRAVAAVSLNDPAKGRALADEAVALDPGLGVAHTARSYALQAQGDLEAALAAAAAAVEAAPEDAYAWARLAELELTAGDRRAAERAAAASLDIAETALGRTIEGFAALAANDFAGAERAFQRAIAIDSEAPLPRLGLGLALIRQGSVAAGRLEMETAVALDPRRASLRTWLGRAYLEERMPDEAAGQFDVARELDPDDPNTLLFSALERFEANDPIGALRDIQAAEAAGGRRAVVRSESGLAEDEAVRSVAAGRVLDVLGFNMLATQKAARAVDLFPTSPEAHRFLFDAYRGRPGFEVAQTSELLRYQLLSPPTNDPVQPSLSEPSLALLSIPGVTRPTFYEFSPLFNRDGWFGVGFGAIGNNGILGDEVAFSYLNGPVSISLGQFGFRDDGFRLNDDVEHDVVSLLAKYAPTPEVTFTAEARRRETNQGDRFLRPFPYIRLEQDLAPSLLRFGVHAKASANLDLLAFGAVSRFENDESFTYIDRRSRKEVARFTSDILAAELQGIYQFGSGHMTAGTSLSRTRGDGTLDSEADQAAVYAYAVLAPADSVELTVGASYDSARSTLETPRSGSLVVDDEVSQLNPKFGVRAQIVDGLILRGAAFRTSKRSFVSDQTLEPTTLAGFSQFFDDFDGTDAWTAAAGADLRVAPSLWLGAEYLYRQLEMPAEESAEKPVYEGSDQRIAGYANATIADNLALSAGVQFSDNSTEKPDRPGNVRTLLIPVGVRYFHPSGFFAAGEAIWADQSAEGQNRTPFELSEAEETGFVLNGALGYRLPGNRGLLSLEIENLLDNKLSLQNTLVNTARPSTRLLSEELSVIARLTVSF
jgi:tetratricopeptide (TPR) repeat protein